MSIKNPLTPAGIEPATFRFVAQHLNRRLTYICRALSPLNSQTATKVARGGGDLILASSG